MTIIAVSIGGGPPQEVMENNVLSGLGLDSGMLGLETGALGALGAAAGKILLYQNII